MATKLQSDLSQLKCDQDDQRLMLQFGLWRSGLPEYGDTHDYRHQKIVANMKRRSKSGVHPIAYI